jgi:hypothetical protein
MLSIHPSGHGDDESLKTQGMTCCNTRDGLRQANCYPDPTRNNDRTSVGVVAATDEIRSCLTRRPVHTGKGVPTEMRR